MFRPANKAISMVTASGAALPGGRHTVDLTLLFPAYRPDGTRLSRPIPHKVTLYDADIGCDAILSYAWLRTHRIGFSRTGDPHPHPA